MSYHEPVLIKEVLDLLRPKPGDVWIDATLGTAGFTLALIRALGEKGLVIGIDRDPWMLRVAEERLQTLELPAHCYKLLLSNFAALDDALALADVDSVDGCLFDLGASSLHFANPERGFSLQRDGPLDMRYDPETPPSAAEVVNTLPEAELARVFREYGEERWASRIARRVVEERQGRPICRTLELAAIVEAAIPRRAWPRRIHPATRVFQALRIFVNGELEALRAALPKAFGALKLGGRLGVVSFHSLEDREVKRFFREKFSRRRDVVTGQPLDVLPGERLKVLTRRPVTPSVEETNQNPSARSAKLRVAMRV